MSTSNEQNGRQPTQKTTPPTDPRLRNVSTNEVCRDYIWGICVKGARCRHPHVRDFESMKETLKFCHDYQNMTVCHRPECTYLHTTKEEQNLFLTTGQIPRVLAERYMREFLQQPPPPPPMTAAVQPNMARPPLPPLPALPALLAPPPPPPPPTEAPTPVRVTPPKYTSSTPQATPVTCPANQQALRLPTEFDARMPPPPLPPLPSRASKRHGDSCEAGPSKARKADSAKGIDLCDSCVRRKFRLELYRQEMEKLQYEKEYKTLLFEKKMEDYENGRLLLRSIVTPELFHILEEYVERPAASIPAQDILSQLGHSFGLSHSSVSSEDSILLSLGGSSRARSNSINNTSPDLLQTMLELIRTTTTRSSSERSSLETRASDHLSIESRAGAAMSSPAVNGLHSLLNGQRSERPSHAAVVPRFPAGSPSSSYMSYPPPVRPFLAQTYPTPATTLPHPNPSFNAPARLTVPQTSARASLPASTTNMQNFNQDMLGHFPPQPPFYPPYQ